MISTGKQLVKFSLPSPSTIYKFSDLSLIVQLLFHAINIFTENERVLHPNIMPEMMLLPLPRIQLRHFSRKFLRSRIFFQSLKQKGLTDFEKLNRFVNQLCFFNQHNPNTIRLPKNFSTSSS